MTWISALGQSHNQQIGAGVRAVLQRILIALTLMTSATVCVYGAAPLSKEKPVEANVSSVPPALPTEVKIVSTPPATPAEVKIISTPEDRTEKALVAATWWLLCANMLLCLITSAVGWKQSRDMKTSISVSAAAATAASTSADAADRSATSSRESVDVAKRQARDAVEREVNRAAHKVMATATRLGQLASEVPPVRSHLHTLLHQGGMPPQIKEETEKTLQDRQQRLKEMSAAAFAVVELSLAALADAVLTSHLWRLDEQQVQLETMRDSIVYELDKYESEILTIRQQQTAMQAAALNARLTPTQLKTKLGE